jgi:transcriptional regulator with XRE-family HTH domain
MTSQTTARRIRQSLQSMNRTDADLAAAAGIPLPTLVAELNGTQPFDYDDFDRVATALGRPHHELMGAAA